MSVSETDPRPELDSEAQTQQEEASQDTTVVSREAHKKHAKASSTGRATTLADLPRAPSDDPRTPNPDHLAGKSQASNQLPMPPITKHTLSELDVTKIVYNSKLRHDINFDPELHFRPNLEGDRGKKKQERSNSFWRTLRDQLSMFVDPSQQADFFQRYAQGGEWCLPILLKTIKEILETLVPQRDRQLLDEGLNVDLKMQEFYKGALDLNKMADWLSGVLKSHCAPMRDEEVDSMATLIQSGNQENDIGKLVLGMRELLTVLEHMKLDVANHQIRCLRPMLIQDTVHFEQRFFAKKIAQGRVNIDYSKEWYEQAKTAYGSNAPGGFGAMHVLFEGLTQLILPSRSVDIPETFQHDQERLMKFRGEALDAINLDICMRLYDNLERMSNSQAQMNFAAVDEASRTSSRTFSTEFGNPFTQSRPSSLVFSDASSPRSSFGSVPAYVAPDLHESSQKSRNLYNSLLALLYTAPHASNPIARWQSVAPAMAVEIFRYLNNAPPEQLQTIEMALNESLCQYDSGKFREAEMDFHGRLMQELSDKVREYKGLSCVSLYTAVSERKAPQSGAARDLYQSVRDGEDLAFDDLATRLAHVGILHWRVWAGMAYMEE